MTNSLSFKSFFRSIKIALTAIVMIYLAIQGYQWQELSGQADKSAEYPAQNPPLQLPTSPEVVPKSGSQVLVFPVQRHNLSHVISAYGDPRGNRLHQGIDIKAERGTPIVAVASGFIERVKEGGDGGKQIYLRGADGRLFYYAHLEDWEVQEMEAVEAGQLIGSVGDSGNASNTTPHLHFEILLGQDRDAVDPTPFFSPNS